MSEAAFKIATASGKDIQVDPHAVRGGFELAIVTWPRWIGLEECLHNIAIPKPVTPAVGIRVIKKKQIPEPAFEPQIKCLGSPERAHRSLPFRIGILPLPIRTE